MKLITRTLAALSVAAVAVSLVGCSQATTEDAVETAINALLDDMESGKIEEATKRFNSNNPLRDILGSKPKYTPEMTTGYTDRSVDEVSEYGRDGKKGYFIKFSFNVGKDRITQELEAVDEGKGIKFISSPDKMFGVAGVSAEKLTGEGNYAAYSMIEGTLVKIGGVPIRPEDNNDDKWTITRVPVGNYKVDVRSTEFISTDIEDGGTLKVRPGDEDESLINLVASSEKIDLVAQESWSGLKDAITQCATNVPQVPVTCDTIKKPIPTEAYWDVTKNDIYLDSLKLDEVTAYSPNSSERRFSVVEVPVNLGGQIVRSRSDLGSVSVKDQVVEIDASVVLGSDGNTYYRINLNRGGW